MSHFTLCGCGAEDQRKSVLRVKCFLNGQPSRKMQAALLETEQWDDTGTPPTGSALVCQIMQLSVKIVLKLNL